MDRVQLYEDHIDIVSDESLSKLYEACKAQDVMLVVDVTRAYPLLMKEKVSLKNCDYLISDLT